MWKKLAKLISGKDCELRERMLRTIIFVGGAATVIATVEILFVMEVTQWLPLMLAILVIGMGVGIVATFKYHNYDFAATFLGFVIVAMVMPSMFVMSGGAHGGAGVWLALGLLYVFVMFSGKKLIFFLTLGVSMYAVAYWRCYNEPDMVIPLPDEAAVYFDSYFSVIVVGVIAGLILKSHMQTFEAEHKLNIEQKEELERSSDAKNVFFASMSHEIRTPINAIIGLNEMIMRENPTGATSEYARDIQIASQMLLNQVNDILDLSQIETKKMKIIPAQYQTEEVFGELVEVARVQAEKKKLELFVDIDKNLPKVLFGDAKRIKQVLLNILDNAVKYTEEGSVTLTVLGEELSGGEITLKMKVADTGIGIRKEDMDTIYDSFSRVDEKKNSRVLGSGLGLSITKQLVDLMNGEITIDSIYTKGSIFTVILKQSVVDASPIGIVDLKQRVAAEGEVYRPSFAAPEARILLVDDNKMNAVIATRLLSETKVQIDTAHSGAQCLEMTKKKYYHVILLDYMMPDMNGTETMKAVRVQENGLCRDTAIVALTANVQSGAREEYLEQGFDGYLEKPVKGKILEAEILKFLPPEIIEKLEVFGSEIEEVNQIKRITGRKRKKIYVTTECSCDIPTELLEKYDVKLMYLYIRTPHGRFADTREIDADSLTQYISADSSSAYADSGTVEEYEEFFADMLTQAEQVVHISMASLAGKTYEKAVAAAKGFDHVHVVDSGQISCGQGLIAMHAAMLAKEGMRAEEICKIIEKEKDGVQTKFITPGADIFYQNGRAKRITAKVCRTFGLHPFIAIRQKRVAVVGLLGGSLESAWKQGIRWHLRKKKRISRRIVFVSHAGCSVKQLEFIKKEIMKCVPFERIIVQKASFTIACNAGMEAIGISYYTLQKK
ncbi:MAG: DegV family protein [Lachnospiraceae bacterium]|nr:DegV family protein [Lachnospiraceae bacterium]